MEFNDNKFRDITNFNFYLPWTFLLVKGGLNLQSVSFPLDKAWPSFFCLQVEEGLSVFWPWLPLPTASGVLQLLILILFGLLWYFLLP